MSRDKLAKLGLKLPLFPTTSVGSFPKPDYLVKARGEFARGKITPSQIEEEERRATEFWIGKQEELGVDVLVDGEQYRGDMVAYFAEQLPGFEQGADLRHAEILRVLQASDARVAIVAGQPPGFRELG